MIISDIHKLKTEDYISLALEIGFSYAAPLAMDALEFRPEVRSMCSADRCRSFGKSWSCPPAAGSLESITQRASGYCRGIIVQTCGKLRDDFDLLHEKRIHLFGGLELNNDSPVHEQINPKGIF